MQVHPSENTDEADLLRQGARLHKDFHKKTPPVGGVFFISNRLTYDQ